MAMLLLGSPAYAHKVFIYAWTEGNTIHTQSKFSGGKQVHNGIVEIRDESGHLLNSGKTNEKGEYSFRIDQLQPMHIKLKAGMGHSAEWVFDRKDINELSGLTTAEPENESKKASPSPSSSVSTAPMPPGDRDHLQNMIENALDKKLQPVYKMLAEQREETITLKDILGGIGYIIGLIGLAAYIRYRKQ